MPELFPHRIADLVPATSEDELDLLTRSVRAHGLRDPIALFEGRILDGRARYAACRAARVEPRFKEYAGVDPIGFCLDANLRRRHLTPSGRAVLAAALVADAGLSVVSAARECAVGETTVREVLRLRAAAAPGLMRLVTSGLVTVGAAAELAELTPAEQEAVLRYGDKAVRVKAASLRRDKKARQAAEKAGRG